MLVMLFERAGSVVSKDEFMDALWPEGFVEESNLTQHVYLLRRVFAERGFDGVIETYPRRGYCLRVPSVTVGPRATVLVRTAAACAVLAALLVASAPAPRAVDASFRETYELGRYYLNLRSAGAMMRSIGYFSAAISRSPREAAGYAGLADAYTMLADFERPCSECNAWRIAAELNARKALALDPASAEAHVSAGMVARIFRNDDDTAAKEFRFALSIDPNNALAHEWYGNLLVARGELDEARRELEIAAEQQPVATATYAWLARADYYARRYAEAERYAQRALDLEPTRLETRVLLGLVQEARGEYASALHQFDAVARLGAQADAVVLRASVIAAMGRREAAIAMLRGIARRAAHDPYASRDMALAYAAAKDDRAARATLARVRYTSDLDRRLFSQDPHIAALQPGPAATRSN